MFNWKWKTTTIDFSSMKNWVEKERIKYIFNYVGIPDTEIHEFENGKYTTEYNMAIKNAIQLGMIEKYPCYEDILIELENYLNGDDWTSVNGEIAVKLIKNKLKELGWNNGRKRKDR